MKQNIVPSLLWLCLVLLLIPGPVMGDNCIDCHTEWEEGPESPSSLFESDIHHRAGLGCSDCHGGDPKLDDMDEVRESKNYRGVPEPKEIPKFCASCHSDPAYMIKYNPALPTDQLDKYKTSTHGRKLLQEGDEKAASCISCHSAHSIESPQIPASNAYPLNLPTTCAKCHSDHEYMAEYGIPVNQFDDYTNSVHGKALLINKDLGAPACNDCHGNHGATPPGITSISAVCGLCHALIADEFSQSPHKNAFDDRGYPECESCHSNHLVEKPSLDWVGTSDSALCMNCHSVDDGTAGLEVADKIHGALVDLNLAYEQADAKITEADLKGMMTTDLQFMLKEVKQAIIKANTAVHAFDSEKVLNVTNPGMEKSELVYQAAIAKVDDYYFRRKGLGVASLIITILAIALYFKLKSIEKRS
ncbi:MAG: hypothetical protein GY841_15200 [FCB group bacterium]|nr:hypothetical protein [FCB group bacterium]